MGTLITDLTDDDIITRRDLVAPFAQQDDDAADADADEDAADADEDAADADEDAADGQDADGADA